MSIDTKEGMTKFRERRKNARDDLLIPNRLFNGFAPDLSTEEEFWTDMRSMYMEEGQRARIEAEPAAPDFFFFLMHTTPEERERAFDDLDLERLVALKQAGALIMRFFSGQIEECCHRLGKLEYLEQPPFFYKNYEDAKKAQGFAEAVLHRRTILHKIRKLIDRIQEKIIVKTACKSKKGPKNLHALVPPIDPKLEMASDQQIKDIIYHAVFLGTVRARLASRLTTEDEKREYWWLTNPAKEPEPLSLSNAEVKLLDWYLRIYLPFTERKQETEPPALPNFSSDEIRQIRYSKYWKSILEFLHDVFEDIPPLFWKQIEEDFHNEDHIEDPRRFKLG